MKTKKLTEVLERAEAWPPHIQNELAEFALELDAGLRDGEYEPTPEELAGIDRGLRAAAEGRFASDRQVEAAFAKFRGKWVNASRLHRGSARRPRYNCRLADRSLPDGCTSP
jgi:hypothetical protein